MNSNYAYIYDDFLSDRRYERDLAALETKLNTLDLAGRIARMTLFRSPKELVEGMVQQGAKTIVIVGNDGTLEKAVWFLPDLDVTVGFISLVGPSEIARLLGIPLGVEAGCDVLAARKIECLDVGHLGDRYFLTEATLPVTTATLHVEQTYRATLVESGSLTIRNLGNSASAAGDPRDGLLEAIMTSGVVSKKQTPWSKVPELPTTRLFFKEAEIESRQPVDVQVDHHIVNGSRFTVKIEPRKFRCITGRSTRFPGDLANPRAK